MMTANPQLQEAIDFETMLGAFARRPSDTERVPLPLFLPTGEPVAVFVAQAKGGLVRVSDRFRIWQWMSEEGIRLSKRESLRETLRGLAARGGFDFDGCEFFRDVSTQEVPTAILNLGEVEIGAVAAIISRISAEREESLFKDLPTKLRERLGRIQGQRVRFGREIPEQFRAGDFLCVVDGKKPLAVKPVTNKTQMLDAIIVAHEYQRKLDFASFEAPHWKLPAKRRLLYTAAYPNRVNNLNDLVRLIEERAEAA